MTKYNFAELGRVYIRIYAKPYADVTMLPVDFKVDTGADATTISKSALMKLGYSVEWINQNAVVFDDMDKPTTATGDKVNAGYIQLPLINFLGYECKNWSFQIIVDENRDFRNLLGRDLLAGFNYSFDNDLGNFTIGRAKAFKPIYELLPNQEISEISLLPKRETGDCH